ncbi:ABC transporter ATP-binding protein [Rhodococcus sp. NPDC003348]
MTTRNDSTATDSTEETTDAGLSLRGANLTLGDGAGTVVALDAVDLTVAPGEFVAVVGPSGSGKSSLLAVAGGLGRVDSGTVLVDGHDLTALSRRELARFRATHIGFVFQSGNLLAALTATEQLQLLARMAPRSERSRFRDPRELLEAVGLGDKLDRRPDQLSGGERQRVGIARALVARPSVLLVDEPTAALDRARSQDIVRLLAQETRQSGTATVMVTHDYDVLDHCDRVVTMTDGRLTAV